MAGLHPENWLKVQSTGLYCEPGGFYIDPARPVDRAVITHGHSDHARSGHAAVLATAETAAIMAVRYGDSFAGRIQTLAYGDPIRINDVSVTLLPAGHILGSAQVLLEHAGSRVVISGDFKRRPDPTCIAFMPVACDVFITEATFGLPVFRHPPDRHEIDRLLQSHPRARVWEEERHGTVPGRLIRPVYRAIKILLLVGAARRARTAGEPGHHSNANNR